MKTVVRVVANNTDIVLLFCTIEMKKMLIYINIYIYIYIYIYGLKLINVLEIVEQTRTHKHTPIAETSWILMHNI